MLVSEGACVGGDNLVVLVNLCFVVTRATRDVSQFVLSEGVALRHDVEPFCLLNAHSVGSVLSCVFEIVLILLSGVAAWHDGGAWVG